MEENTNEVKALSLPDFQASVRWLMIQGDPWFVAADVCKILDIQNTTDALKRLADDEKLKIEENRVTTDPSYYLGSTGTPFLHEVNVVNEPGLYRLIFMSRKPEAEKFKHKVFHEILPSIRKYGYYVADPTPDDIGLRNLMYNLETTEKKMAECKPNSRLWKQYNEYAEMLSKEIAERGAICDVSSRKTYELDQGRGNQKLELPHYLRRFIADYCEFSSWAYVPAHLFIARLRQVYPEESSWESNVSLIRLISSIKGIARIRSQGSCEFVGIRFKDSPEANDTRDRWIADREAQYKIWGGRSARRFSWEDGK